MKFKNLFAILLTVTLLTCTCILPTNAKESVEHNANVEIIINDKVSEETKANIEKYFASGEPTIDDNTNAYGLTCTLLGHKSVFTIVETITHKVRTTSPRCVRKTYDYEECTRCDYSNATLIATEYIVCCS